MTKIAGWRLIVSILRKAYASAPADPIIQTLEVKPSGVEPIRGCIGYEDLVLTLEDENANVQR